MTYCFLDIETTGLDPETDKVLEVAWVLTDSHFNILAPLKTFIVDHVIWADVWHLLNNPDNKFVYDMHTKSGLLAAMANKDTETTSLDDIYQALSNDLARESVSDKVYLSGRSVHFDKSFLLAEDFGALFADEVSGFHHRMLDLSSVKLMLESAGVNPQQFEAEPIGTPHRAADDVMNDILYARSLRSYVEAVAL